MLTWDEDRRLLSQFVSLVHEEEGGEEGQDEPRCETADLGSGGSCGRGNASLGSGHGSLGLVHEVIELGLVGVQRTVGQPRQRLLETGNRLVAQFPPLHRDLGADEGEYAADQDDEQQQADSRGDATVDVMARQPVSQRPHGCRQHEGHRDGH